MTDEAKGLLGGSEGRIEEAIDRYAARIRQLEETEARLHEQDATYWDPRIAAGHKILFDMLVQLQTLESSISETADGEDRELPSQAAADGAQALMRRIFAESWAYLR